MDIQVYNTNGCHLYSIEVGDNSQKSKVAYLYNGSIEAEAGYAAISGSELYTVEPVEATGTLAQDAVSAYDAIVISPSLTNAEAIASLKDIRPFVPVLNLNPALYEAWGMGTTADSETPYADVTTTAGNALFRGLAARTGTDRELVSGRHAGRSLCQRPGAGHRHGKRGCCHPRP